MRVGVITNPRSGRNRRDAERLRAVLAAHPTVAHVETASALDVGSALSALAEVGTELLVVNGGDGTVQGVLTALNARQGPFAAMPALAVLASGTTNQIAVDAGTAGPPHAALGRLLAGVRRGETPKAVERRLLGVTLRPGEPTAYGMLLGAGAFHDGVALVRRTVYRHGGGRVAATALGVGLALVNGLCRRSDPDAFRGVPMRVEADGVPGDGGPSGFILMATTLERLMFGLWPFWGGGDGPIRLTRVAHPPRRLASAILPALRGRPRPWMEPAGYVSRRVGSARLGLETPIVLDGEILRPTSGVPVTLDAARRMTFVRA